MQIAGTLTAAPTTIGTLVAVLGRPPEILTRGAGRLDDDGQFAVTVPDRLTPADDGLVSPAVFCADIDIEPPELLVAILPILFVHDEQGESIGQLIQATGPEALAGTTGHAVLTRWYADRASSVTGTQPCGHEGRPMTFDVHLQPGWNQVLVEFVADDDERLTTTDPAPALPWHAAPLTP